MEDSILAMAEEDIEEEVANSTKAKVDIEVVDSIEEENSKRLAELVEAKPNSYFGQ